jgi:arylsulfatase A-like enzyme
VNDALLRSFAGTEAADRHGKRAGAYGDHGGAQQEVQEVPMVFWSPNLQFRNSTDATFRTPDMLPTILWTMGIRLTHPVDGKARDLDD